MKIPRKLKIGGQTYTVRIKKVVEPGQEWNGSADFEKNELALARSLNHGQREATLFHEIIEILNEMYQLRMSHNHIMTLETALYQVLKDNKLLSEGE